MEYKRSPKEMFLHLVWSTKRRERFLVGELERAVHRCIQSEAQKLGCQVFAVGGMSEHIHLVLQLPTTRALAQVTKQVKGVSSAMAQDLTDHKLAFRWQESFGVFSFAQADLFQVASYVKNQKEHHANGTLWQYVEEFDSD